MEDKIKSIVQASIDLKNTVLNNETIIATTAKVSAIITETFKNNGKVYFCGNGGSAADAQHLAAEFSGRFYYDRDPLFAEALHVNTSYITAVANDYSYDEIYARLIKAKGSKGDILIGLSTSGNSNNIVRAFLQAQSQGVITIGFTGEGGGKMVSYTDILLSVPSKDTPRIQEVHMLLGHIVCQIVEENLFPRS